MAVCHCTDCQTLSGSAFRVVVSAKSEKFGLLSRHSSVPNCPPKVQIWRRSALGWTMHMEPVAQSKNKLRECA
ncbi:MAG: GFA family protein [Pseudomonadota bacterium]|nr:GFA family protein [Pseudomonadota bacterium]